MDRVIPTRKWDIYEYEAESDIAVIIDICTYERRGIFYLPIYDAFRISIILCFEMRGILVEIRGILIEIRGIWIDTKYKLNKNNKL